MWTVVGTIAVVLVTIVLGMLADRRWGLIPSGKQLQEASKPRPLPPPHAPGEAPATALELTPIERAKLVDRQRCAVCKVKVSLAGDEPITYDGRVLRVLAFSCPGCGHRHSLYLVG
jgi:hypothetical protein